VGSLLLDPCNERGAREFGLRTGVARRGARHCSRHRHQRSESGSAASPNRAAWMGTEGFTSRGLGNGDGPRAWVAGWGPRMGVFSIPDRSVAGFQTVHPGLLAVDGTLAALTEGGGFHPAGLVAGQSGDLAR
jgi:hypothetical protein